jgi:hypothetical protein
VIAAAAMMPVIGAPTFRIVCLFHRHFDILKRTLPRCLEALTGSTRHSYELILHCDNTPGDVATTVLEHQSAWGIDEVRFRVRQRHVASGDPSNNGHRRLFDGQSRYLVVIEDDVWMHRSDAGFDVLDACIELFERHQDVPTICKLDDNRLWAWQLDDVGAELEAGALSVRMM